MKADAPQRRHRRARSRPSHDVAHVHVWCWTVGHTRTPLIPSLLTRLFDGVDLVARLTVDPLGRHSIMTGGSIIGVSACLDEDRAWLALARDTHVAISRVGLPDAAQGEAAVSLLAFSQLEREKIISAPSRERGSIMACWWARKEAALRLSGSGRWTGAPLLEATVAPKAPLIVPGTIGARQSVTAWIQDLPSDGRTAGAVATCRPAGDLMIMPCDAEPGVPSSGHTLIRA